MGEALITRRGGGGMKFASGTQNYSSSVTSNSWGNVTITGIGFNPKFVTFTAFPTGSPTANYGTIGYREIANGKQTGATAYSKSGTGTSLALSRINADSVSGGFTATVQRTSANSNWTITWYAWG